MKTLLALTTALGLLASARAVDYPARTGAEFARTFPYSMAGQLLFENGGDYFSGSGTIVRPQDKFSAKVDHIFNNDHRIAYFFNITKFRLKPGPAGPPGHPLRHRGRRASRPARPGVRARRCGARAAPRRAARGRG